jgi:tripartite-type tricarboxylate transporter receptor subunit TctC
MRAMPASREVNMRGSLLAVLLSALAAANAFGQPQQYPTKPIRVLVGFPPGGNSDFVARVVARGLGDLWGQQAIVENRPGAGGNIAAEMVAKAPPDGHTLLLAVFAHTVNPSLYSKLPFDPLKDFAPILLCASAANVLVVHPSLPVKSVKEMIALAKAKPGAITYASAGNGTASHLAGELLRMLSGIDIVHVPYRGTGPAHTDLMGGRVTMLFGVMAGTLPSVRAGRLRALAVTTLKRWPGAAEVPTMSEAGVSGFELNSWSGLLAPAGTPRGIVMRLNTEVARLLHTSETRERLYAFGAEPAENTPEEFAAYLGSELAKWAKVVKAAGIKAE